MNSFRNSTTVMRRELKSYFESPVAYVFMIVFLVLLGSLTFFWPWSKFYERGLADLQPFFFWHPVVYLLLIPAATMGLWAEERRSGSIELLLTMPITMLQAIIGKFLAAWIFIAIGVLFTLPIVFVTAYLGDPDWGPIICGYLGSIMMAGAYVAIGMLMSSMTHNQVIAFVLSLLISFVLMLSGTPYVTDFFHGWAPNWLVDAIANASSWTHFQSMQRGVVDLRDMTYYASIMAFMIFATHIVLENRKSA